MIYSGVFFIIYAMAADYTFYTYIRPIITKTMGLSNGLLNIILFMLGICFICGNKLGGVIANHGGIKIIIWIFTGLTLLLLSLGSIWSLPWLACLVLGLICICLGTYGATIQVMFLDVAERDYPQSIDLASSLNSIFSNIGISLGSLTAAQVAGFAGVGRTGYFAAIYAALAVLLTLVLRKAAVRR